MEVAAVKLSFTWQQLCRGVVTICLVAFIVVHTFVQQHPSSPDVPKKVALPALSRPGDSLSPRFEAGMIFPRWGANAYNRDDADWSAGLREIQAQTGARWIAITITFHQTSISATQVKTSPDTPTPKSLAEGIRAAKQLGYKVFIIPMISVDASPHWSGSIHFSTLSRAQTWFESYWQTLQPYVVIAQEEAAEQFALGNELEELQTMPALLWQGLVDRIRHIFTGAIVYDMNWTSLKNPVPSWMRDKRINSIGISTYVPLTRYAQRLDARQLPAVWHEKIDVVLDAFAMQLGRPIFLSELGYRNTAFAGYNPWLIRINEPRDDSEQAALFSAALQNIATDTHISGVFLWAWSLPPFAPNGKPAAQVIHRWYSVLQQ